ncbi:SRPBCC family protein [Methylocystis heyeri]|uniref:SRPBCC family protein n=1 Tax=Methylocystis heyeri TaxID=391905 RepID=A0A6B8KGQ2_9HYPH|nr:SRPBCC family protein [Methylocystis heyeri]QGM45610.1 SRPBCC family protein [Methylocystis heyeri]
MSFVAPRRAFLAAALSLVPAIALAHGPSRQKVVEKIEIDAPPAKVWEIVGNFGDINWLPGVAKTEATGGNTPEQAKRKLTLSNGGTIDESLTKYDAAAMSLSYKIDQVDPKVLPVNNYSSTITVTPADGGKSTVEWKGAFYRGFMNNDPPPELSDEAALKAVGGIYTSGLAALKAKAEGK